MIVNDIDVYRAHIVRPAVVGKRRNQLGWQYEDRRYSSALDFCILLHYDIVYICRSFYKKIKALAIAKKLKRECAEFASVVLFRCSFGEVYNGYISGKVFSN